MYGFHKIPHLQQGVLKSDTETEFWNFAHANFHRGQPDLLCLIQRKKPLPQGGDEGSIDLPGGITFGGALPATPTAAGAIANGAGGTATQNGNATLSPGQILDIHSIANGITAIKRHQSTISSELSELKRSNQLLWQDALASRGRQQKQQDTINRIVKFLAGVFGQHTPGGGTPGVAAGQHGKEDGVDGATGMGPGTKRKMRLMIEDAKRDGPKKTFIEELNNEIPLDDLNMFNGASKIYNFSLLSLTFVCIGYPSIGTPVSAGPPSPSPTGLSDKNAVADSSPTPSSTPGPENASSPINSTSMQQPPQEQLSFTVTPSRSPTLPMFEFDPRNVLNHLSPAQFQQLLASLAAQNLLDSTTTGSAPPVTTVNPNATNSNTESNLTPYHQPTFDISQPALNFGYPFITPETLIPFESDDPPPSSSSTTTSANGVGANGTTNAGDMNLTLLNAASSVEQREHEERMAKQWESAEIMEDDVNGLHSRIHSLAQALGLDPVLLDNDLGGRTVGVEKDEKDEDMDDLQKGLQGQQLTSATGTTETLPTPSATTTAGVAPTVDFDFDSFFNNIASSSTDMDSGMDFTSTAFLDEAPTPASSSDQTASLSLGQDVASEVCGVGGGGTGGTGGGGPAMGTRKRKSVELDNPTPATKTTAGVNKSKRRKEK